MAKIKIIVSALSSLMLLAAVPAFALAVSTAVTGDTYVGTNAATSTGVNMTVGASDSANTSGSSTDMNASDNAEVTTDASADLSVPLVITRADVDNSTVQASSVAAGSVQTKSDLSGYIAAQIQSDSNLAAVDTASDHVAVTYPEQAKLFGFIPVTIDTTATTDASGNVSITQPWWSFLAASDQSALQANVQSSVQGVLGANASSNTQLTASQQAQLVAAIRSTMAVAASTETSANVSGNAGASY